MSNRELTHYIKESRKAGRNNDQITHDLLAAGWQMHQFIDYVLDRVPEPPRGEGTKSEHIISVRNVSKYYGKVVALDNVSLDVKRGGVTALLGPNGAGKTTLVRILTTLLMPTFGRVEIAGLDVALEAHKLRSLIGLAGQYAAVDEVLSGRENLEMFARLYHLSQREAVARARELLAQFDLTEAGDRVIKTYSGGMRRRLDLAASLVIKPKILFLDEPTTGLDPRSRFLMWEVIRDLVREGTTVLLTTQYLEEADQLAQNIFVIDHGRIIAEGTPDELKNQAGGDILELHVLEHKDAPQVAGTIKIFGDSIPQVNTDTGIVTMPVSTGAKVLVEVVRAIDTSGHKISDIRLRRPSLDDVFMKLTGHSAE